MCSNDTGLWYWDATAQVASASDDTLFQRRGWRGVLSFFFQVCVRQGKLTLAQKSLQGVHTCNT